MAHYKNQSICRYTFYFIDMLMPWECLSQQQHWISRSCNGKHGSCMKTLTIPITTLDFMFVQKGSLFNAYMGLKDPNIIRKFRIQRTFAQNHLYFRFFSAAMCFISNSLFCISSFFSNDKEISENVVCFLALHNSNIEFNGHAKASCSTTCVCVHVGVYVSHVCSYVFSTFFIDSLTKAWQIHPLWPAGYWPQK